MASKSQPAQQRPPETQLAKWPLDEDLRSLAGRSLRSVVRTSPRVAVNRDVEFNFHPLHGVQMKVAVEAYYSPSGPRTPICVEHVLRHEKAFDSTHDALSWARDAIAVDTQAVARAVEAMVAAAVAEMAKP